MTERIKNSFLGAIKGEDFSDVQSSKDVISVVGGIQYLIYSFYIVFVLYQYDFYYGYENIQLLPNAVFVDMRYSFYWVFLFIQLFRIVTFFFYHWLTDLTRYSYWIYSFHKGLNAFYIIFDIVYLVVILISGLGCNASWWPDNVCNDPNYCKALGYLHPTLCRTEDNNVINPNQLQVRLSFSLDFWFTFAFLMFDLLQMANAKSFHLAIIRFLEYNS